MHVTATPDQAHIVLSAMLAVASAGSAPTDADRASIAAAARYIFRLKTPPDFASLSPPDDETLRMLSANTELAREAASFATVMAFVDGQLDEAKLRKVLELAARSACTTTSSTTSPSSRRAACRTRPRT